MRDVENGQEEVEVQPEEIPSQDVENEQEEAEVQPEEIPSQDVHIEQEAEGQAEKWSKSMQKCFLSDFETEK